MMPDSSGMANGAREERLPAWRLVAPGNRPADALTWAARAGAGATAVAAMWFLFVAVRPLPVRDAAPPDRPPAIPAIDRRTVPLEQRRAILGTLARDNLFDDERMTWTAKPPASASAPAEAAEPSPPRPTPGAMPEEVRSALSGLALRGVYDPPGGGDAVALISRVHAGPNPLAADPYRVGDEFEDKHSPQAKWKVRGIDVRGGTVLLERAGVVVPLALYAGGGARPADASAAHPAEPAAAARPALPEIVVASREAVAARLLSAGLSEAEVRRLLELSDMSPAEAEAAAAMDALAREAAAEQKTRVRPPPPGLDAIINMLRSPPKFDQPLEPEPVEPPPEGTPPEDQR